MFNSKLTIKLVPITFTLFACTRVLTTVLPANECHSTNKWVTWDLLKNIFSYKQTSNWERKMNCVLLTLSTWYKQTVHHTHIYKLEIITKCVINALQNV